MFTEYIAYHIQLCGETQLFGSHVDGSQNATFAHPLGGNIFIITKVFDSSLKMVKIRVTGETSFKRLEAYHYKDPPTNCRNESTFTKDCYTIGHSGLRTIGNSKYDVKLVAVIKVSGI